MTSVVYNPLTGQGTARDKAAFFLPNESAILPQQFQETLAEGWPMSEICSDFPKSATEKWCELAFADDSKGLSPEEIAAFDLYRKRLGAMNYIEMSNRYARKAGEGSGGKISDELMKLSLGDDDAGDSVMFYKAGYRANVHGGSAIVMVIDDGRPSEAPVNYGNIQSIRRIEVVDRHHLIPDLSKSIMAIRPSHYYLVIPPGEGDRLNYVGEGAKRLNGQGRMDDFGRQMYYIHRSRLLIFPGENTPEERRRIMYNGWWRSKVEVVWEHYKNWHASLGATASLIQDYSVFVWQIANLDELIQSDKKGTLQKKLEKTQQLLSNYGGMMIGEDESVNWMSRSFSEIPQILDEFKRVMTGAGDVSHTRLFDESPSGLGATGNSEARDHASKVRNYQVERFQPKLEYLYTLIFLAKDGPTGGKIPEGWRLRWASTYESTPEEDLNNLSSYASVLSTLKGGEIITPDEARSGFEGSEITWDITLNKKEWDKLKQQQEQLEQQQMEAQQQEQLPPREAGAEEGGDIFSSLTDDEIDSIIEQATANGLNEGQTMELLEEAAAEKGEGEKKQDSLRSQAEAIASQRFRIKGSYWKAAVEEEYIALVGSR